jgi:hypothetical protein
MSLRMRFVVGVIWFMSLVAVAAIARAQMLQIVPLPEPIIVSGNDVGFRVEGKQGSTPVGRLVLRINGQWVEADFGSAKSPHLFR